MTEHEFVRKTPKVGKRKNLRKNLKKKNWFLHWIQMHRKGDHFWKRVRNR